MAKRQEDISFSFTPGGASAEGEEQAERSPRGGSSQRRFRVLIMADFSGRTNRGVVETDDLAQRKIRTVDVDNLDATLAAMKPELRLPVDEKSVIPLTFSSLEDFRPDALLQNIPALQTMLMLRGQLQNNSTFAQAATVVRQLTGKESAPPTGLAAGGPQSESESEFEKMLNRPVARKDAVQVSAESLIANLVAGYSVPAADPEQKQLVALVEDAISAGLRAILRHPAFQALESAWRGVAFLTSRLDTDAEVTLTILDISREELSADLVGRDLESTALYGQLVEKMRTPGSVPISLAIGDYAFDQSGDSVALLGKLGELMQAAGISLAAAASAEVAGVTSFQQLATMNGGQWRAPANLGAWEQLRQGAAASHVGLTVPRFLLRLPYGPKTDAVDAFAFEEMPGPPVHEQYLWGNGAFVVALLCGEAVLQNGFEGAADVGNDVSDLPCHMAMVDGDREMTPCAEAYLPERSGEILRSLGLIPLLSVKNQAAIKMAGISSLAHGKGLAGLAGDA